MLFSNYKSGVLQELREKMTEKQYEGNILSRLCVVEVIIMDEFDRPSMDRPPEEEVASMIIEEFEIGKNERSS